MTYYVRGPDGKRVLKVTKRDQPKVAAQLAEVEARAKPKKGKHASGVADRRKFNGRRKPPPGNNTGRTRFKKKPKKPPEAPKYDLLTLSADKLTPELQENFKRWIMLGMTQEKACWQVGINPMTLRIWQAKAMDPQEPDPKYGEFIMAIQKAESNLNVKLLVGMLRNDGDLKNFLKDGQFQFLTQSDARAAAQMLRPSDFGNRAAVTVNKETGGLEIPGGVKPTLSEAMDMTLEEYELQVSHLARSLERVKARGGIRHESEGIKEPKIGHPVKDNI